MKNLNYTNPPTKEILIDDCLLVLQSHIYLINDTRFVINRSAVRIRAGAPSLYFLTPKLVHRSESPRITYLVLMPIL